MKRVLAAFASVALLVSSAFAADNVRTSAQKLDTSVANNALSFDLFANETLMGLEITGLTASGATLTLEGSTDGRAKNDPAKVWFANVGIPFTCPSPSTFTTVNADGPFKSDVSGLTNIRIRVSSTGTGNALVSLNAIPSSTLGSCGGTGGGGGGGSVNIHDSAGNNLTSSGGALNVAGTFSATLGGFTPSSSGARMASLTVQVTDSSQTLPTGAVTVVSNVGTTNPMYCNVNGIAATVADQQISPSSWFAFTIPATITTLHCIATGGTTTADGVGGAGLPTGAGGGGGGGGSSSSAGFTPSGVYSTPLAVTSTTGNTALPTGTVAGSVVILYNQGTNPIYYALGNSGVTATTSMAQLGPYAWQAVVVPSGATNVAALTKSAGQTATLGVELGTGTPNGTGGPINLSVGPSAQAAVQFDTIGGTDNTTAIAIIGATAAGTSSTKNAMAVQGITGGVALPATLAGTTVPLPTGAATAANQEVTVAGSSATSAQGVQGVTGGVALPVSAASLPLPTGAATAANQEVTVAGVSATSAQGIQGVTGGIALPVSAAALPLPSGAATSANQTNASQKTQIVDGSGNVIASTSNNLNVQCANCSGSGVSATDRASFTAGTSLQALGGAVAMASPGATTVTAGLQGAVGMSTNREQWMDVGTSSNLYTAVESGVGTPGSAIPATGIVTGGSDGTNYRNFLTSTTGHLVVDCGSAGGSCSGSGGTASNFGSAFPTAGTAIGLTNGTNMVAWSATTNYGTAPSAIAVPAVNADVTNVNSNGQASAANSSPVVGATGTIAGGSTGTAGSAGTTVVTVQGIASMTPLLANPGTAANWGVLAQGSTTSGQLAELMMGAVTTAAPSYSTTQSSPLSLDTAGNLRVNVVTGGGTGGTSGLDKATWTVSTTPQTPIGCEFTTGGATTLSSATMGTLGCTNTRGLFTDKSSVAGTALGAVVSNLGTLASGTPAAENVNMFMVGCVSTVCNSNGPAAASASSPVVVQGQQATGTSLSNNNPVLTGGSDGTAVRSFLTSTTGHLVIDCGSAGGSCSGSGGTSSTFGSAFPTTGTALGVSDGTNMIALRAPSNMGVTPGAVPALAVNASLFVGTGAVVSGSGNVGTGSPRFAVGIDTATIAGSAPGTAGTASANVLSVQGIASMTPLLANPGTAANWGVGATGSAPPANANYMGANGSGATGGQQRGVINCDNHVFKHITTATDTNAITGVTSQVTYICSWRSRAAGVATWFLETSANTAGTCGTPTQINGVATEAANTGETWGTNFWSGLKTSAANGVCINSTGTGGVDIDIWYAQF